jgi:tetratricopeptide (TPR) repeat protein
MQGDKPVVAMGEMIKDESWGIRKLGWQGLTTIDSQRKIDTTTRQAVLEKLWKMLRNRNLERYSSDEKRSRKRWQRRRDTSRLEQHVDKLYLAVKSNDLASIEVLQLEAFNYPFTRLDEIYQDLLLKSKLVSRRKQREILSENSAEMLKLVKKHKLRPPALVNLLRPNDWEIVKKWIEDVTPESLETKDEKSKSPDGSDKIYKQKRDDLDMILASWVRRLEMAERYAKIQASEIEKPDPDTLKFLFDNATKLDRFLYRSGSTDAINYTMQKGEPELQQELAFQLLDRFDEAYQGQILKIYPDIGERFRGSNAISRAVKIDAEAEPPFKATLNLLESLESKDEAYWKLVKELVKIDAEAEQPFEATLNLLESFESKDEAYWKLVKELVKIDAGTEPPFKATLNLLESLESKDEAYWKLVEELVKKITKENANPSIRQVLYQVVQQIPPDLANYSAVHASIRSLKLFIKDDEQAESVDQLMLTLQSLTGIKDDRTAIDDAEAKKINDRKRRIMDEIMNLFRNYYRRAKQKDLILRKLDTGRNTLQEEDLSYVRSRFTNFVAEQYLAYVKYLLRHKETEKAQLIFQKAIDLDPDNPQFFIARADMWGGLGKYDQAVADLDQAILNGGKGRNIYLVHKILGLKLLKDDHQATEKIMQTAVKLAKTNREKAGAMENIGLFYLKTQQWEQSFKNSDEVNKIYDKMSWNWLIRAIAAKQLDKAEEETVAINNWCNIGKTSGSLQSLKKYVPHEVEYYDEHSILKLESACTGNQSGS